MAGDVVSWMDSLVELLTHPLVMVHLGLLANLAKEMIRLHRETKRWLGLKSYFVDHRWHTVLTGVGCYAALALTHSAGELGPTVAFAIGFMADSMAEVLGKRGLGNVGGR